ncbi:hypothetical protein ACP70R_014242 [Stipagrostis hirtigluma subsp. patula]
MRRTGRAEAGCRRVRPARRQRGWGLPACARCGAAPPPSPLPVPPLPLPHRADARSRRRRCPLPLHRRRRPILHRADAGPRSPSIVGVEAGSASGVGSGVEASSGAEGASRRGGELGRGGLRHGLPAARRTERGGAADGAQCGGGLGG